MQWNLDPHFGDDNLRVRCERQVSALFAFSDFSALWSQGARCP